MALGAGVDRLALRARPVNRPDGRTKCAAMGNAVACAAKPHDSERAVVIGVVNFCRAAAALLAITLASNQPVLDRFLGEPASEVLGSNLVWCVLKHGRDSCTTCNAMQ